jgi:hypothetical protein
LGPAPVLDLRAFELLLRMPALVTSLVRVRLWGMEDGGAIAFPPDPLSCPLRRCYTAYNAGYYWNGDIRAQYAANNKGAMPAVQGNDVAFAIHAGAPLGRG